MASMQAKRTRKLFKLGKADLRKRVVSEGLKRLSVEELPVIKHFFEDSLAFYLKTPAAEKELDRVANDESVFEMYREALRIPGATKLMAKFLQSRDGTESFIRVGKNDSGLKVLVKLGQVPEGRKVARHMIVSPLYGWPAIYKILKELGNYKVCLGLWA